MIRREREKDKNKERRNRGNRKYGQAKFKHSKKGIVSCCIAVCVLAALIGLLAFAYVTGGTAAPYIGGLGLTAFAAACFGLWNAIRGLRERDKNYLTCKIGIVFHILFIAGFIAIFCRGLF